MRKILSITIAFAAIFASCNSEENTEIIESETQVNTQQELLSKNNVNETFITKVGKAFNKTVQLPKVWDNVKYIITHEDLLLKSDLTIKDVVLPFLTIRDDIFLTNAYNLLDVTIKDDILKTETTVENLLIEQYRKLYPEDEISSDKIEKTLVKFHIGFPKTALDNYEEWENQNFPTFLQAYDNTNNEITKISKEDVIRKIGEENYQILIEKNGQENELYSILETEEKIQVIASKNNTEEKSGTLLELDTKNNANTISFSIKEDDLKNYITVYNKEESYTVAQGKMIHQTIIDIYAPEPCNGFYVFELGSAALQNYLAEQQARADRDCETYGACLPLCEPYSGTIGYYMFQFTPSPKKCAIAMDYLDVLTSYALAN